MSGRLDVGETLGLVVKSVDEAVFECLHSDVPSRSFARRARARFDRVFTVPWGISRASAVSEVDQSR
jgi:hypothetical protein